MSDDTTQNAPGALVGAPPRRKARWGAGLQALLGETRREEPVVQWHRWRAVSVESGLASLLVSSIEPIPISRAAISTMPRWTNWPPRLRRAA
jgi:ParB family chromosome partitioning protein